jgi:hypothetical protein
MRSGLASTMPPAPVFSGNRGGPFSERRDHGLRKSDIT